MFLYQTDHMMLRRSVGTKLISWTGLSDHLLIFQGSGAEGTGILVTKKKKVFDNQTIKMYRKFKVRPEIFMIHPRCHGVCLIFFLPWVYN